MTKILEINYCGECKYNEMCVTGKKIYPYCGGVPAGTGKFIKDGIDCRAKGFPSWCPLPDKGGEQG